MSTIVCIHTWYLLICAHFRRNLYKVVDFFIIQMILGIWVSINWIPSVLYWEKDMLWEKINNAHHDLRYPKLFQTVSLLILFAVPTPLNQSKYLTKTSYGHLMSFSFFNLFFNIVLCPFLVIYSHSPNTGNQLFINNLWRLGYPIQLRDSIW